MKKRISIFLVAVIMLTLCACRKSEQESVAGIEKSDSPKDNYESQLDATEVPAIPDNYEEVAIAYARAYVTKDLSAMLNLVVANDGKKAAIDSVDAQLANNNMTLQEWFQIKQQQYAEQWDTHIEIDSYEDVWDGRTQTAHNATMQQYGEYTVTVTVTECEALEDAHITEFEDYFYSYSKLKNIKGYIDLDEITPGYQVDLKCEIIAGDYQRDFEQSYEVVLYKGEWKVLSASFLTWAYYGM